MANMTEATPGPLPWRENLSSENGKSGQHMRNNVMVDDVKSKVKTLGNDHMKTPDLDVRNSKENGRLKVGTRHADDVACAGLPTEVYITSTPSTSQSKIFFQMIWSFALWETMRPVFVFLS